MMEIQLSPTIIQQAQELANARQITVNAFLSEFIMEEALHAELEKQKLRMMLSTASAQADRGEGAEMDPVFDRILSRIQ